MANAVDVQSSWSEVHAGTDVRFTRPSTPRRIRLCGFNTWAGRLEPAQAYVARARSLELAPFLANPADPALRRKARLDCDWHAENIRCLADVQHPDFEFLGATAVGPAGLLEVASLPREPGEERWLVFAGQQPQALGAIAGKVLGLLHQAGVRIAFYAFDEASRAMPCFREIAPHLDVLIHDEAPLDPAGERALNPRVVRIHRSWVANLVPFAAPFNEAPERKILFLGSQLGLTEHRRRQIAFLQDRFKDRFVASHDHSVEVADRLSLSRYKVGFCPEGRKFTTPAMSRTHTDRPFWSGCLGMVPVSENSVAGDRLDDLTARQLILRYPHSDLEALARTCEQALDLGDAGRRRIYEHFNRNETIGTVLMNAIATAPTQS